MLFFIALGVGSVFSYLCIDARADYKAAEMTVNLAGDNYKAQQKADDTKQQLDKLYSKWRGYRLVSVICFSISVVSGVFNLHYILISKNIRE